MRIFTALFAVFTGVVSTALVTSDARAADDFVRGRAGAVYNAGAGQSQGRAGTLNVTANIPATTTSGAVNRMPSLPSMPGSITIDVPTETVPKPDPNPNPGPGPGPNPNPNPDPDPDPKPTPDYSIDDCMKALLTCVNGGGLPNGLNDMYNEDVRNSIMNGMNLCRATVEYCIANVKRDGKYVYRTSADVWLDFNSRIVQPEYYSFILRKTGLTPYQAENTCWLLDKNTYGSSFTAVSVENKVTREYNVSTGAFNKTESPLTKDNPMGVTVNNGNPGVDGKRGHYARWDATNGECLVRVGAYNKDKQITNSWLFGAAGDDKVAENWKKAGETFTCNKDLFGFNLRQNTQTVAVVGIGGGALVGAGTGAIIGAAQKNTFECSDPGDVKDLLKQINESGYRVALNDHLPAESQIAAGESDAAFTAGKCNAVLNLMERVEYDRLLDLSCSNALKGKSYVRYTKAVTQGDNVTRYSMNITADGARTYFDANGNPTTSSAAVDFFKNVKYSTTATADMSKKEYSSDVERDGSGCVLYKRLNAQNDITFCTSDTGGCVAGPELAKQIAVIDQVFDRLPVLKGRKSQAGKGALIGAGVGIGAGGLATAITAFVEKSNISCRVGDGLEQVSMNKSGRISTLKEFYVKWNLQLPDTIRPTAQVTDCASWRAACATVNQLQQCDSAQINYKPSGTNRITLVDGACMLSGSVCMENYSVAKSHGACE